MSTFYEELPEHEGYVVCVFADGYTGASYQDQFVFASSDNTGAHVHDPERRPERDVMSWRATCECGWRGADWERSFTLDDENLGARKFYSSEALLDEDGETRVLRDWEHHLQLERRVPAVRAAATELKDAQRRLDEAILNARTGTDPLTWETLGRALGMTRQSVHEKYGSRTAGRQSDT